MFKQGKGSSSISANMSGTTLLSKNALMNKYDDVMSVISKMEETPPKDCPTILRTKRSQPIEHHLLNLSNQEESIGSQQVGSRICLRELKAQCWQPRWHMRRPYLKCLKTLQRHRKSKKWSRAGMFVDVWGGVPGWGNDHMMQNDSLISDRLSQAQAGNARIYDTGADKGFHNVPCVKSMPHARPNTAYEDQLCHEFSPVRVPVEMDIGRNINTFKRLDYRKINQLHAQPLASYYRAICIVSNAFTCLGHNQTSKYFNCEPPTLEEYFIWSCGSSSTFVLHVSFYLKNIFI